MRNVLQQSALAVDTDESLSLLAAGNDQPAINYRSK